jgi:hypothetical protein
MTGRGRAEKGRDRWGYSWEKTGRGESRPTAVTGRERRVRWVETGGGQRNPNRSDTMLGIDKLYSIEAKGHSI